MCAINMSKEQNHLKRLKEMDDKSQEILIRHKKPAPNIFLRYSHLGLEFAGIFGVFFYLGYQADRLWATSPWLTIVGAILGFVSAMLRLVRVAQELERLTDKEE